MTQQKFYENKFKAQAVKLAQGIGGHMVLKHYKAYISYLSMRWFYDENGMPRCYVDDEKREMLEIKLITKILDFKVTKAA